MEKLLNKLIEKGWKPRGIDQKFEVFIECLPYKKIRVCLKKPDYDYYVYSYRELVSKESGLWQFVCENGMVKDVSPQILMWQRVADKELSKFIGYNYYEYRLIESALCNEEDLEQFLLDNIKIDGE